MAAKTNDPAIALPVKVWEKLESATAAIGYGSVTVIVQDGRAIQIELNEKIRLTGPADKPAGGSAPTAAGGLRAELTKALAGLQYGQVVILIKDGKVTQLDRTEKKRLAPLQGVHGDGI